LSREERAVRATMRVLRSRSRYLGLLMFLVALIALKVAIAGPHSLSGGLSTMEVATSTVQLFAIMDPISALPLYLYFEEELGEADRGRLWTTVVATMVTLLFFFALAGNLLLRIFGVSIYSFMLGGGVLLMILAVDIMGEGSRSLSLDPREAAVVPLASPLLVGPGTATALIIMSETMSVPNLLLTIAVVATANALILRFSKSIARVLGRNGIRALSRLLSIIIAGFAAQLMYQGLVGWGLLRPL